MIHWFYIPLPYATFALYLDSDWILEKPTVEEILNAQTINKMKETLKTEIPLSKNILELSRPYGNRVYILPDALPKITKLGMHIPDSVNEKPMTGEVVALGASCKEVKLKQHVLFGRNSGTNVEINGQKFIVMRETDVVMDTATMKPFGDRVVIKQDQAPKMTDGGIIIPDTVHDQPQAGTVIDVGHACVEVVAGARTLFGKFSGMYVTLNENIFLVIRESDVFANISK